MTIPCGELYADDAGVSVLFTGYPEHNVSYEQAEHLMKQGFNVNRTKHSLNDMTLTLEELKKYNVVIVSGIGMANADFTLTAGNRQNSEVLRRYIEEGGGVIFIPSFVQNASMVPPQEAFCSSLGLNLLFKEIPFDPKYVEATAWKIQFAYADTLTAHETTEGVQGIWYPINSRSGGQSQTTPFLIDSNWTRLIAGSSNSYTKESSLETCENLNDYPYGHFTSEVPLAAVRSYGKGRVAVWAIAIEHLFGHATMTSFDSVVYSRGVDGRKSDGIAFVENLMRYCAEPSQKDDSFGGAEMDRSLLINPLKVTQWSRAWNWRTDIEPPPALPGFAGVIGARTERSTGKNSVAEWVDAARKQGLSYIVFLEKFSELTEEEFASLKKECEHYSNKDVVAIPGFTIDDAAGNHYFYLGDIPYPAEKLLDAGGDVFASYAPDDNNAPGQLSKTTLTYMHTICSMKLTAGNFLFKSDASPCANWFCNWDVVGVFTGKNGVEKENAIDEYLTIADAGQWVHPVAIELMDSVEYLTDKSKRTILTIASAKEIRKFWNTWKSYPRNPSSMYVTEGPSIDFWGFAGPREYVWKNRGDFVWQNLRWNVHGTVTSAVGLRDVRVMDGDTLFRHFSLQGEKEFSFTLKLNHEKQHNLVVVVTDSTGAQAISAELIDKNQRFQEVQCSDRNNHMPAGLVVTEGDVLMKHGGFPATPNKRIESREITPTIAFRNSILGFSGLDGNPTGAPTYKSVDTLLNATGIVRAPRAIESRRLLHTGDVHIGEGDARWYFTDDIPLFNVWYTLWKTRPADIFTMKRRFTNFQIDTRNPLPLFMWESDIEILQDQDGQNGFELGFIRVGDETRWAFCGSDGHAADGTWGEASSREDKIVEIPLDGSGYIAHVDTGAGGMALFSLTPGVVAQMNVSRKVDTRLYLRPDATPRKKGEKKRVTLLFMAIPKATPFSRRVSQDSVATVGRFYGQFGLAPGTAPSYLLDFEEGKLEKYGIPLSLSLNKSYVSIFNCTGELISSLPVTVSQANDNWSAYLYDYDLEKSRPLGVFEGKIWATLAVHGSQKYFIGHPVSCTNKDAVIQLSQTDFDVWSVEIHNPTANEITVDLEQSSSFEPFEGLHLSARRVTVAAGSSVDITIE
jgi:hypothetical protein